MLTYQAVVIGASAGGVYTLRTILSSLPADFSVPIIIVCHLPSDESKNLLPEILNNDCSLIVKEAVEREKIKKGHVYVAPPSYHLLLEKDLTLSFSVDLKVSHCRPAIDVLFKTAADALGKELLGVILTGANADGAEGSLCIKDFGGKIVVQDPNDAKISTMPRSAINTLKKNGYAVDYLETAENIASRLLFLAS